MFSLTLTSKMCYYDQYKMACGCYKWGHFRQHCRREYQTGETCSLKLVMVIYMMENEKCKLCTKLGTKWRRIAKEQEAAQEIACKTSNETAITNHDNARHQQTLLPEISQLSLAGSLAEAVIKDANMRPYIERE